MKTYFISIFCFVSITAVSSQHVICDGITEEIKNLTTDMETLKEESKDTQEKVNGLLQVMETLVVNNDKFKLEIQAKIQEMLQDRRGPADPMTWLLPSPSHSQFHRRTIVQHEAVPDLTEVFDPDRPSPARWEKWVGTLPKRAFPGGEGPNGKLYIGLTFYDSFLVTGMVEDDVCYFTWGGEVMNTTDFYILINPMGVQLTWKPTGGKKMPSGALLGGISHGKDIYIAKTFFGAVPVIGKASTLYWVSFFPKDGKEVSRSFEDSMILCQQ